MQRSTVRVIGFGDFGNNVISGLLRQGFEPEHCMTIDGNAAYLRLSPVKTRVPLEPPDDLSEKYCYHEQDPIWGNRMVLRHGEFIRQWCSGTSLVIMVITADDDALVGAAVKTADSIRKWGKMVVSFLQKPLSSKGMVYGVSGLVAESDMSLLFSLNRLYACLPPGTGFHAIYERSCRVVGSIIFDMIEFTECGGPDNISLLDFAGNGIGYAGHGEAASVKEALDLALTSPTLEYSVLDRAGVVFAYFRIQQAADMNDRDKLLAHLRNSFDRDIYLFTGTKIDPELGCRVTIIATSLL